MNSRTMWIGLLAVLLAASSALLWRNDRDRATGSPPEPATAPSAASVPLPPADPAELIRLRRALKEDGLEDSATAALVLAYLEARFRQGSAPPAWEYWRPAAVREARQRMHRYALASFQRQSLRAAFGNAVAEEAAYAPAFRPYAERLPFLPPAEQQALQELGNAADAVLVAAGGPFAAEGPDVRRARREFDAALARLLKPADQAAYALRESPLSRSLADSGFDFTQSEFDRAFAVLAAREPAGDLPTPRRFDAESLAELRPVLGEARFAAYLRQQSPLYQLVRTVVLGHGAPDAEVDTVYDLIREYWADEAAEGGRPVRSIEGQARWSKRQSQRDERLRTLIGAEAAGILAASLAANRTLLGIDGSGQPLSAPPVSVSGLQP